MELKNKSNDNNDVLMIDKLNFFLVDLSVRVCVCKCNELNECIFCVYFVSVCVKESKLYNKKTTTTLHTSIIRTKRREKNRSRSKLGNRIHTNTNILYFQRISISMCN